MAGPQSTPQGDADASTAASGATEGSTAAAGSQRPTTPEGSKFKRFLKRFGRRPSDEGGAQPGNGGSTGQQQQHVPDSAHTNGSHVATGNGSQNGATGAAPGDGGSKKGGSTRSKRSSSKTAKRSDSLLSGRFFQTSSNAPPVPASQKKEQSLQSKQQVTGGQTAPGASAFGNTNVGGLANTLTLPSEHATPPPQLGGVPRHDPIVSSELMSVPAAMEQPASTTDDALTTKGTEDQVPTPTTATSTDKALPTAAGAGLLAGSTGVANVVSPAGGQETSPPVDASTHSSYNSRHSGAAGSFDTESDHRRDSVDNQTMNTGKSRASTKPTTLMSLDTRENVQGSMYAPIAQTGQPGIGDQGTRHPQQRTSEGLSNGVQFVATPPMGRSASGTIVALPGQNEISNNSPYQNVPSISRPHPSNNPHPSSMPADNASMLTLASSTAAASIGGGAASSRGHSHAAPSLGGARSIGGSYMGERRNSSDTYASVKALPPLSRRGSDSSQRTGRSIAASATGRNSAQAMTGASAGGGAGTGSGVGGVVSAGVTGPGAPPDRISIHRTASQRTIATQLSIPLSTSNQVLSGAGAGQMTTQGAEDGQSAGASMLSTNGVAGQHGDTSSLSSNPGLPNITTTQHGGSGDVSSNSAASIDESKLLAKEGISTTA